MSSCSDEQMVPMPTTSIKQLITWVGSKGRARVGALVYGLNGEPRVHRLLKVNKVWTLERKKCLSSETNCTQVNAGKVCELCPLVPITKYYLKIDKWNLLQDRLMVKQIIRNSTSIGPDMWGYVFSHGLRAIGDNDLAIVVIEWRCDNHECDIKCYAKKTLACPKPHNLLFALYNVQLEHCRMQSCYQTDGTEGLSSREQNSESEEGSDLE